MQNQQSRKKSRKSVPGVVGTMPQKTTEKSKKNVLGKNDGGKKRTPGIRKTSSWTPILDLSIWNFAINSYLKHRCPLLLPKLYCNLSLGPGLQPTNLRPIQLKPGILEPNESTDVPTQTRRSGAMLASTSVRTQNESLRDHVFTQKITISSWYILGIEGGVVCPMELEAYFLYLGKFQSAVFCT